MTSAKVFLSSFLLKQRQRQKLTFPYGNLFFTSNLRRFVSSPSTAVASSLVEQIDKLKLAGFEEAEAEEIVKSVDAQLEEVVENLADFDSLKSFTADLESKSLSAFNFAISNAPIQIPSITNQLPAQSGLISTNAIVDPTTLEREIQITGQQLTDDIRQLQADFLLDANLESKRDEQIDILLEEQLEQASRYAEEKITKLNEHLNRVSTQVLTAIGGFIGLLTTVFVSYSLLSSSN